MAAALEYAHSLIFTIFYVLPVDEENQKFIPGVEKKAMLLKISKLIEAVKIAREQANDRQVEGQNIAGPILSYIFDK